MLKKTKMMSLLAAVLAGGIAAFAAAAQPNQVPTSAPAQPSGASPPFAAVQKSKHTENFYRYVWGIDKLEVRETASGVLLRFSYRIADAKKAHALNDERATPYLIDEKTGAVLQIPTMPKVGLLRQTAEPRNGVEYWMVFSNKGNFVKPGNRVDIVIGSFRVNGLMVQ